jgi:iron complex outermembrane receptor protein
MTKKNLSSSKPHANYHILSLALFCAAPAWSLESPAAMDEVIVTAQMREENPQSVGIAMGVYDKDFIANAGANSLTEMEFAIPNLNFGFGGRNTRGEIAIRGIGGYARNIGTDARVAVYIDGVLTGRSSSFDQSLLDVEQIEVLRGPQGTLSGTNALAGAINITTQKPENKFTADVFSEVGNYNLQAITAKINAPLTSDLYASLLIGTEKQDGFIHNITLDRDLQGVDRNTAKLKFRYVGIENLTLDLGFDYLNDDNKSTNAEALANGKFNGFTLAPKPYEVADGADEFEKRKLKGTTLTANY